MASVGNFWKNLNNGNGDKLDDEGQQDAGVNSIPQSKTTDEEIDALIDSLEKNGNAKKVNEEKPVAFNTDLFKQAVTQEESKTKTTQKNTTLKKEQAAQKNKKESQVDKVMETGKKATIITKSTIIAGNISTEDDLIIDGSVCGDVDCKGELTISGEVAGNAIAASINIKTSKFDGDVRSDGKIDINEGTIVLGNIYGDSANIAGAVKGEIVVTNEAKLEPTAIVKGNIRAKSVQIEHGAVLQGFCELAYESMDLDDFFGEAATDEAEEVEAVAQDSEQVDNSLDMLNKLAKEATEQVKKEKQVIKKDSPKEPKLQKKQEDITSEVKGEGKKDVSEDEVAELELVDDNENKKEFMEEMENNYSSFMDQLKIDPEK